MHCARKPTSVKQPKWHSLSTSSTACWCWDARATSASYETTRAGDHCVHRLIHATRSQGAVCRAARRTRWRRLARNLSAHGQVLTARTEDAPATIDRPVRNDRFRFGSSICKHTAIFRLGATLAASRRLDHGQLGADSGRSQDRDRAAGVDPQPTSWALLAAARRTKTAKKKRSAS